MTLKTHRRLSLMGFMLIYFAVMGGLVAASMPALDPLQHAILWYLMLPAGMVGIAAIAVAKMTRVTDPGAE